MRTSFLELLRHLFERREVLHERRVVHVLGGGGEQERDEVRERGGREDGEGLEELDVLVCGALGPEECEDAAVGVCGGVGEEHGGERGVGGRGGGGGEDEQELEGERRAKD